jgi:thioredoxin-related protein
MPEITTSQLINIIYFSSTKCDYCNTLSKHCMEMPDINKNEFQELKMLLHSCLEQSPAKKSTLNVPMADQKHEVQHRRREYTL